jgi:MFS family permease
VKLPRGLIDITPLRVSADFRRLWLGGSLSMLGGQLTVVAVLSQVWEITSSSAAVGAIGLAHAIPTVIVALLGGTLADALDRRRLALITTAGQTIATGLLAAQALLEAASFPLVLALVALQAACGAAGAPAKRTFIARLLPEQQVGAGVALMHLGFQTSMLVGPALAGLIIAGGGVGVCYAVDTATFTVAMYCFFRLPPVRPSGDATAVSLRATVEGWRFIAQRPVIGGALLTDVLATVMAMPIALFPAINDERFGGQPETLGLLISAVAVGGTIAGLTSGIATRSRRPGAVMLAAAATWGLGLAGFGLSQALWLAIGCLAVAGAADTISVISRGSIIQIATPDSHRGRVTAVEHVVGVAGPDLGNFRGGLIAGMASATFAMVSGGVVVAVGIAALAIGNRKLRRFNPAAHDQAESATARL